MEIEKEHYFKDLSFDEWLQQWHDLNVAVFGQAEAMRYWKEDKRRNDALRKLWKVKGFKTLGQFEEWEKDHMKEKNDFIRRELEKTSN